MSEDRDVVRPALRSQKIRIVLIEDSEVDAELVARQLARAGLDTSIHRVMAESEFLAALRNTKPDLILSDFTVPGFGGLRALELALADVPDVPFVFVSGTIGEERAIDALHRGATDYVLKSSLARLSSAVERALREASLKLARREQEARLVRLTRSYRMLSATGSAILRLHNRRELLGELCQIAVEQGGYDRVVVSLMVDGKILRPHASAGRDTQLLRAVDHAVLGSGGAAPRVVERVIRDLRPVVQNDLPTEGGWPEHRDVLLAHGYRAFAAFPLLITGAPIGVLTLASCQPHIFDEAEVRVLNELTANLGYALQSLQKDDTLHFLSHFNSLTGLAQRSLFCQRLAQTIAACVQVPAPAAASPGAQRIVLVFDVQDLGNVNESLGHDAGDRLIEQIGARIKQSFPNDEATGHFGGGTYAITVSAESEEKAEQILKDAIARMFLESFWINGQELRPLIRSGLAVYGKDADSAEVLVQRAEAALMVAREENEKCVSYHRVRNRPTSRSLALEVRLARALEKAELSLHYQPKIEIATRRLMGLEALLRWHDCEHGPVAPSLFIPMLERSGLIVEVGDWVLREAARDRRHWIKSGVLPGRIAVNVSPLQLRQRDFVERLLRSIQGKAGEDAGLDIEITESMLMHDLEESIGKLAQVRAAGVGVAIDDFGTGYSSLRLMSRLPVDALKIDRGFVQGLTVTPGGYTLVSTIVSLAHAFEMRTVAEGVETLEQLKLLRRTRCDEAQGFYLGRPMPASEVAAAIARRGERSSSRLPHATPAGGTASATRTGPTLGKSPNGPGAPA